MARALTTDVATAVAATRAEFVHLVAFTLADPTTLVETVHRWTTAPVDLSWDGHTWEAVGGALTIGAVRESPDVAAAGFDLVLSGVDQTVLSDLLASAYLGRSVRVWRAHLHDTTKAILSDPVPLFAGQPDGGFTMQEVPPENGQPGTATITARCVSHLARLEEVRGIRMNVASHGAHFPGDLLFSEVDPRSQPDSVRWE